MDRGGTIALRYPCELQCSGSERNLTECSAVPFNFENNVCSSDGMGILCPNQGELSSLHLFVIVNKNCSNNYCSETC